MVAIENGIIPLNAIMESPRTRGNLTNDLVLYREENADGFSAAAHGGRRSNATEDVTMLHDPLEQLLSLGYYNGSEHVDLTRHTELREVLREHIAEAASQNKIRVIIPFVDEGSVGGVIRYNQDIVGLENVLAIDSGASLNFSDSERQAIAKSALRTAQNSGSTVVSQVEQLLTVDWARLKIDGILPSPKRRKNETDDEYQLRYERELPLPPGRGKGLTLLSGMLHLYKNDMLARSIQEEGGIPGEHFDPHDILDDDVIIMFHDSDVVNADQYDATTHAIGFPLAYPPFEESYRSGQIARMGAGRNNYPVASETNLLSNMGDPLFDDFDADTSRLSEQMGTALQTVRWQLSGEWWVRWGDMKTMMGCNGMGIETVKNVVMAGHTIESGIETRSQVVDVQPKIEDQPTNMEHEWKMIYALTQFLRSLAQTADETQTLPNQWTFDHIAAFNQRFGGKMLYMTVPLHESYSPNPIHDLTPVKRPLDVLIPSIDDLWRGGYIIQ